MDVVAVPKTIREYADADKARAYRNRQRKINYDRDGSDRRNHHKPWSKSEVDMILEHRLTDREIARAIGRSVAAIQVKRSNLKRRSKKR